MDVEPEPTGMYSRRVRKNQPQTAVKFIGIAFAWDPLTENQRVNRIFTSKF